MLLDLPSPERIERALARGRPQRADQPAANHGSPLPVQWPARIVRSHMDPATYRRAYRAPWTERWAAMNGVKPAMKARSRRD